MCKNCMKEEYPDRDTVCLDNGAYYSNFVGCAECSGKDVLHSQNRLKQESDEEETITYEHACKVCGHLVASHVFKFLVEDDFQEYEMSCMLCGAAFDSRSIMPYDPRQQPIFH